MRESWNPSKAAVVAWFRPGGLKSRRRTPSVWIQTGAGYPADDTSDTRGLQAGGAGGLQLAGPGAFLLPQLPGLRVFEKRLDLVPTGFRVRLAELDQAA